MRRIVARGQGGFTVLEVITALMVIATLVRLAFPEIQPFLKRRQAREVAEAVETVRAAAERFHAERGRWPDDAPTGAVPGELEAYLPAGFRFEGDGYRLDWERWSLPDGLPDAPDTRGLVGISLVTPDAALGRSVSGRVGSPESSWELDDTHTVVFAAIT